MYNSKPKKSDCNCRRRKHGNPKVATGICYGFELRKAVKERIKSKKLERAWLRVKDLDDSDL